MGVSEVQIKDGEWRKLALNLLVSGDLDCLQHRGQSKWEFKSYIIPFSLLPQQCVSGGIGLCLDRKFPPKSLNTDVYNEAGKLLPRPHEIKTVSPEEDWQLFSKYGIN